MVSETFKPNLVSLALKIAEIDKFSQADRLIGGQTEGWTDRRTNRQANKQKGGETYKQTERQTGRQTHR